MTARKVPTISGPTAALAAGTDGIRRRLDAPAPVAGDAYRADPASAGDSLPASLDEALDALEADSVLTAALGPEIVETLIAVKRFETDRHREWVSDWDLAEYLLDL